MVYRDQLYLTHLKNDLRILAGGDRQGLHDTTHFLALHDDDEVEALENVEDAHDAENFTFRNNP